ncbi:MAG: amidase family protein, partial [Acetobacteraceae bacterium]
MSDTDPALMSAETLLGLYARRRLSPVEALNAVMERVARYNPWVNAFATMNPRALQAAGEAEARWQVGRPMGTLDGVPATVKDLLNMAGFPTRRGSRSTDTTPAVEDAPAVVGLKQAGAVIIGKTTTTEFGWKSPGDCPLHGITRNPWNPKRTPGGSSSGAGAAGAACFGPLHIGTDAGGSIRIPAAYCGLVGMKPSFGRIPQWPLGAFGHGAVAGPMTRTVRDAALMLGALARNDLRDPSALPEDPRDWLTGIEEGVAGLRVAVVRRRGFAPPRDAAGADGLSAAARLVDVPGASVEEAA